MDDEEEHQRALEEQWMSGMTGLDEAAAGGGGSGQGQSSLSAFHEDACLLFLFFFELLTRPLTLHSPARARRRPLLLAPEGRLRRLLCPVLAPLLLPHSGLFQEVRAAVVSPSLPLATVPCRDMVLVSPRGNYL